MALMLYRHFKGKDAKAEREATVTAAQPSNGEPPKKDGFWKCFDWRLMSALLIPVTLETLDYTIVATAQTHIASVFNALSLQSYIGTSYLLASTVFLPFFASIADIYGRHFGLQLSLLFFLVGSAFSTGAANMTMVLVGRGIAGIGAAGLLTIVRTILSDSSSLDTNNLQQSSMFFLYCVGFSLGPVAGGYLVTANFRWVFAINLPCVVIAMTLCFFFLRRRVKGAKPTEELPNAAKSMTWITKLAFIDWVGTFLFILGGILVLLALNWGPNDNWKTARVIVCLVIGVIILVACIIWEVVLERKHRGSVISDSVLYQYGCFVSGIVMFVMFYFVAIFMTVVTGLPPGQAGIQLLYFAPGMGGGSLASMRLIKHFRQPIYPIVVGSIVMTVGLGLVQMGMQKNAQGLVDGFMGMTGFGVGLTGGPIVVQARFLMPDHVAITNALMLFFRSLGGTVGLAQCFTVMNAKVDSYVTEQIQSGTISGSDLDILAALYSSGGLTSIQSLDGLPPTVQQVIRDAFKTAVRWSFISLIPWTGLAVILFLFLSKIPDPDARQSHHDKEMKLSEEDETRKLSGEMTPERQK